MERCDQYYLEALEQVRKTLGLRVVAEQDVIRGTNNCVVRSFYGGKPVVVKYYGEPRSPHLWCAELRRRCELFYLERYARSGVVPKVVTSEFQNMLVMEKVSGVPLRSFGERISAERAGRGSLTKYTERRLRRLSYQIGRGHARLLGVRLSRDEAGAFLRQLQGDLGFESIFDRTLANADEICDSVEDGERLRKSVRFIRSKRDVVCEKATVLCKHDWNLGNTLIRGAKLSAFHDFEQCYLGSRLAYLGAVFDCLHFLDWAMLVAGYEAESKTSIDEDQFDAIVAMAYYNHWTRVINKSLAGGLEAHWWGRFKERFARLDSFQGA